MSNEITLLREEIERLKMGLREKDKAAYDELVSLLGAALLETKAIQDDLEHTVEKLRIEMLIGIIADACLPTSGSIGFNFSEVVTVAAKDAFTQNLPGGMDDVKGRFISVLTKVIKNPMAKAVIGSSPFGVLVSSAVDMAASFIETKYDSGGVARKAITITKDVITQGMIEDFMGKLQIYIDFYEKLMAINTPFVSNLDRIKIKNNDLSIALIDYHKKYKDALGLIPDVNGDITKSYFNMVNKPVDENGEPKYQDIMKKPEIRLAEPIARSAPNFRNDVDSFSKEVAEALYSFLTNFISVLHEAETWNDSAIDKVQLRKLIGKIQEYQQLAINVESLDMAISSSKIYRPNSDFDFTKASLFQN